MAAPRVLDPPAPQPSSSTAAERAQHRFDRSSSSGPGSIHLHFKQVGVEPAWVHLACCADADADALLMCCVKTAWCVKQGGGHHIVVMLWQTRDSQAALCTESLWICMLQDGLMQKSARQGYNSSLLQFITQPGFFLVGCVAKFGDFLNKRFGYR